MRQHFLFSILILPLVVPCAAALQQSANSTQQAPLRSKPSAPKWTEAHKKTLLAKAQQGESVAQMWLATAYAQGWFGTTDFSEALKWYRRAAEQGDPDAQNALGRMYEHGEGVAQNFALATKWYKLAAEHDEEVSPGVHLEHGVVVANSPIRVAEPKPLDVLRKTEVSRSHVIRKQRKIRFPPVGRPFILNNG